MSNINATLRSVISRMKSLQRFRHPSIARILGGNHTSRVVLAIIIRLQVKVVVDICNVVSNLWLSLDKRCNARQLLYLASQLFHCWTSWFTSTVSQHRRPADAYHRVIAGPPCACWWALVAVIMVYTGVVVFEFIFLSYLTVSSDFHLRV